MELDFWMKKAYSMAMTTPTIQKAMEDYLEMITQSRSPRTVKTYRTGLEAFASALKKAKIDPDTTEVSLLDEKGIKILIKALRSKAESTQSLYLTAATMFYKYLVAESLAAVNLVNLEQQIHNRVRTHGRRLPKFPKDAIIELIGYAQGLAGKSVEEAGQKAKTEKGKLYEMKQARLRNLRDRAFILFLADTGLRVSEACSLTLGDVDFYESRLTVLGKGDHEDPVRVSERALAALKEYLQAREQGSPTPRLRNGGGVRSEMLPLFLRHDRGAGTRLESLDPSMGWKMIKARALEAAGDDPDKQEAAKQIHPHSFRHYFVTIVLLSTNNIEKARRMARHKSIEVTKRYAEIEPELDEDYHRIFNS
jgi:integrase/recombinase XerC